MYENPINLIVNDINNRLVEERENKIMYEIQQQMHIDIDKDELIRALQYDRHQYEQGYYDGSHMVMTEENLVDWMAEYIKANGIKPLMELVMKSIELEKEREKTQ